MLIHQRIATMSLSVLVATLPNTLWAYSYGNPSVAEQVHLEEINRTRANPTQVANEYGFDLQEGTQSGTISNQAQPPLVLNSQLSRAAKNHSQEMAANDYLDHYSLNGDSPLDRVKATGYTNISQMGENVAFFGTSGKVDAITGSIRLHKDLFVDEDYPNRAHRVNILSSDYKEVGIGLAEGQLIKGSIAYNTQYVTTDFASSSSDKRSFILGVVYDDQNGDQRYTGGEGLSDIQISIDETGDSTETANAGGYGIPLDDGTYTVRFVSASLGELVHTVKLNGENIKVDVLASDFNTEDNPPDTDTPDPDPDTPSDNDIDTTNITMFSNSTHLLTIPVLDVPRLSVYRAKLSLQDAENLVFNVLEVVETRDASVDETSAVYTQGGILTFPVLYIALDDGQKAFYSAEMQQVEVDQFKVTKLLELQLE